MTALETAMKMETDAISFYAEAARRTAHPAGKKMFQAIAEDEKRHLEMISEVARGLRIEQRDMSPLRNVKTVFEAMKNELMEKVEATEDDLEAFAIAMRMEKEGMDYYERMLGKAKTDKEKALFERLIGEEQEHYGIFANTHQFLSDTGNWFMWEERSIVEGG